MARNPPSLLFLLLENPALHLSGRKLSSGALQSVCKTMVEVSAEVGLGEEEIELDLGLSIGGSLRRHEKPRPNSEPVGFQSDLLEHSQHDGNKHKKKRWMMRERDEAEEHQRGGLSKRDRVTGIGGDGFVQKVGFNNGFAFPCWAVVGNEKKNVVGSLAPAACSRGFQPFLVQRNGGGLEHNDERNGVNASSMCSSSVVLEQQSTSHEGNFFLHIIIIVVLFYLLVFLAAYDCGDFKLFTTVLCVLEKQKHSKWYWF